MTEALQLRNQSMQRFQQALESSVEQAQKTANTLEQYLDIAAISTGRASFYNTQEEQVAAESNAHAALLAVDRGIYALMAGLPGASDRSLQQILQHLLDAPRQAEQSYLLSEDEEATVLAWICEQLPITRLLKLFVSMRQARINNARARKLILRSILGSHRLPLWCTRYRKKLRLALSHAWGQRMTSILCAILKKPEDAREKHEKRILQQQVLRFAPAHKAASLCECVSFLFGNEAEDAKEPLLRSYHEAKSSLEAGRLLPYETLEGLRSTYHKDRTSAEVLELTKKQLTDGQKIGLQRKAEESQVTVEMDPLRYDATRLYLYAYARGMTQEIRKALKQKAQEAAGLFPIQADRVGILVDASASMAGHDSQALRPIATSLAVCDMLQEAARIEAFVEIAGGRVDEQTQMLLPEGESSLAMGLIRLLKKGPDTLFILSDGYENAPAGRLAEVIEQARKLGLKMPIYQLSPVVAAESAGVRSLAPTQIATLPINAAHQMGLPFFKAMLQQEPQKALPLLCTELWCGLQKKQLAQKKRTNKPLASSETAELNAPQPPAMSAAS